MPFSSWTSEPTARIISSLLMPVPRPRASRARVPRRMASVGRPRDHETSSVISADEYGPQDGDAGSATDRGGKSLCPTTAAPTRQS